MPVEIMHHAPDSDDATLVACGKTVGAARNDDEAVMSSGPIENLLKGSQIPKWIRACPNCVKEIKAKIAADAAPPQSNVQTAALPESKAGAGPDPAPR